MLKKFCVFVVVMIVMCGGVLVDDFIGMLKKIKDIGVIMVGNCDLFVFFLYFDDKQQLVGYVVDICLKVVDVVKEWFKFDKFEV